MKNKNRVTMAFMAMIIVLSITTGQAQHNGTAFNGNWKPDVTKTYSGEVSEGKHYPS